MIFIYTRIFRLRYAPLNMTGELTKLVYLPVILSVVEESNSMPKAISFIIIYLQICRLQHLLKEVW